MWDIGLIAFAAALAGLAVWALARPVRAWLIAAGVHDAPNERSSHAEAKPRGGGIAVLAVVLPAWAAVAIWAPPAPAIWPVLAGAVLLAAVSFADDRGGLAPAPRFAAQLLAVGGALALFDGGPVLQGLLPLWADRLVAALAWLWFVNLFNFMDGIDGLAGVETVSVGVGLGLVALVAGAGAGPVPMALPWILAGAAAGFLVWNWAPAKVFLGDVGSVPVGYLLGALLLWSAAAGEWAAALILPAYYWLDATWTLLKRVARGDRWWQPHREHAYQRAVQAGRSHGDVTRNVAVTNVGLVGCALIAVAGSDTVGLMTAVLPLGGLMLWLRRPPARIR